MRHFLCLNRVACAILRRYGSQVSTLSEQMASYGYARVSTLDQDLTVQRQALRAAGCSVIRAEKASGSRRDAKHRSAKSQAAQSGSRGQSATIQDYRDLARHRSCESATPHRGGRSAVMIRSTSPADRRA
jgi:Resolvase, N terminal domain